VLHLREHPPPGDPRTIELARGLLGGDLLAWNLLAAASPRRAGREVNLGADK